MVLPLFCGLCGTEAILIVLARWLGIPDPIFFFLLGALMASLGFWTHKILKHRFKIDKKHQVKIIVLAYIAMGILGLWLSGVC